jgi:AraC-like DNA-binding protein
MFEDGFDEEWYAAVAVGDPLLDAHGNLAAGADPLWQSLSAEELDWLREHPLPPSTAQVLHAAQPSMLDDVRHAIAEALCDGAPTIRVVAKRLGTSVRTLQRRLGAEGGVFTTLVEDVRRDVAMRYLADGKANLTDIAFLTGYSELSAFGRAFRRWTGSTPLAVRKQLLAR